MSSVWTLPQKRHSHFFQGPYVSPNAIVGGLPTVHVNIPVITVFLSLYIIGAITNMTIFQLNRKRGHKFLASWAMFAFCMTRNVSCILRIVWATRPNNARLAIAASIFLNLGIMIVYALVLVFASRILRATHPTLGWNNVLRKAINIFYIGIVIVVLLVLSFSLASVETLNKQVRTAALWIQRSSSLYLLLLNGITPIFLLLSSLLPADPASEDFGTGSMLKKKTVLGIASFFCIFISAFRCGVIWADPKPAAYPTWYDSNVCLFLILLGFEIICIYLFIFARFDRLFWVPNGSRRAGDYSGRNDSDEIVVEKESASDLDTPSV
jgi:hypothetical protein